MTLKESLLDVTAKTGKKIDDIKKDTTEKTQVISEIVVEAKDTTAKKVDDF
jgi:hypothetical protein